MKVKILQSFVLVVGRCVKLTRVGEVIDLDPLQANDLVQNKLAEVWYDSQTKNTPQPTDNAEKSNGIRRVGRPRKSDSRNNP